VITLAAASGIYALTSAPEYRSSVSQRLSRLSTDNVEVRDGAIEKCQDREFASLVSVDGILVFARVVHACTNRRAPICDMQRAVACIRRIE